MMLRRAAAIWIMHSLAFVAGLVLSGVVAVGLWAIVPTTGAAWLVAGAALAVSIVAVGAGYGLYLTLIGLLLDVELGWAYYLLGPVIVLAVMGLVFTTVYAGMLSVGGGPVLGYVLLYVIGGLIMLRRAGSARDDAT
ncbi:hypothetical protein [Sagittula sp. S175]|uniref:hypothetical protein n=1 Tax=Sagittula sp. S175 TaxID=3415129 RepID=UPI003C7EB58C